LDGEVLGAKIKLVKTGASVIQFSACSGTGTNPTGDLGFWLKNTTVGGQFVNVCLISDAIPGEVYSCDFVVSEANNYQWEVAASKNFINSTSQTRSFTVTILGDINQDKTVNLLDYSILFDNFGTKPPSDDRANLNTDDTINLLDYSILFSNFGKNI
jgi:hypothetical protein